MRAWSIGIVAGGLLAYGVMEARSPGQTRGSGRGSTGNVTQARVLAEASRGDNWLVSGGNLEAQHFSPLKSITDQNIARRGLAWTLDVASPMGLSDRKSVV